LVDTFVPVSVLVVTPRGAWGVGLRDGEGKDVSGREREVQRSIRSDDLVCLSRREEGECSHPHVSERKKNDKRDTRSMVRDRRGVQ
jgi:hypothetical protein